MSAFSQSETPTEVQTSDTANEVESGTPVGNDASTLAPSSTLVDTYPREILPNADVFGDFVVGPGRFALELAPGESQTVELVISNRMGTTKRFSFETEDIAGSDDPSQAVILLGDQEGPYTLRDYIKIPHMQFDLKHAERVRIPVTVSLPPDAEPGGRYGSLVVSIVSDKQVLDETSGAKPGSAVISRIGTLFFVTTPGAIEQDGLLQDFSTVGGKKFFSEGPVQFNIVLENLGSVHLTPYGEVRIYNMSGSEVGAMELEPWFVMPNSLRTREVSWDREFLIGRYTAVAMINRGYDDIVDEKSFVFWVIPWKLVVLVFGGLFLFFLLLRFLFSKFEFKRKEG